MRIIIQQHTFWRATKTSRPVQQWTFDIADKHGHKVCVVLLWEKSRLYGSFPDVKRFLADYSNFQGRRCFYWINRSYEIKEELSILHFDVEWYTMKQDLTAAGRLLEIQKVIHETFGDHITIFEEQLSRPHQDKGWKNSFHLYTDLLLEHNADGCMRQLVKNRIWGKLQPNQRMWCPSTGKPILDIDIYTKNRTFRIPG